MDDSVRERVDRQEFDVEVRQVFTAHQRHTMGPRTINPGLPFENWTYFMAMEIVSWGNILAAGGLATAKTVFGGSFSQVGQALERYTEFRLRNVGRIVENAAKKSDADFDSDGSGVSARTALRILDEGSYSDEEIVQEYLGGVLASSRTPGARDDRGNTFGGIISGLSRYELRFHYLVYSGIRDALKGQNIRLTMGMEVDRDGVVVLRLQEVLDKMEFGDDEDIASLLSYCVNALSQQELLSWKVYGNDVDTLRLLLPGLGQDQLASVEPVLIVQPTILGVFLYLWAHGKGQLNIQAFLDPDLELHPFEGVAKPVNVHRVADFVRSFSPSA